MDDDVLELTLRGQLESFQVGLAVMELGACASSPRAHCHQDARDEHCIEPADDAALAADDADAGSTILSRMAAWAWS